MTSVRGMRFQKTAINILSYDDWKHIECQWRHWLCSFLPTRERRFSLLYLFFNIHHIDKDDKESFLWYIYANEYNGYWLTWIARKNERKCKIRFLASSLPLSTYTYDILISQEPMSHGIPHCILIDFWRQHICMLRQIREISTANSKKPKARCLVS